MPYNIAVEYSIAHRIAFVKRFFKFFSNKEISPLLDKSHVLCYNRFGNKPKIIIGEL